MQIYRLLSAIHTVFSVLCYNNCYNQFCLKIFSPAHRYFFGELMFDCTQSGSSRMSWQFVFFALYLGISDICMLLTSDLTAFTTLLYQKTTLLATLTHRLKPVGLRLPFFQFQKILCIYFSEINIFVINFDAKIRYSENYFLFLSNLVGLIVESRRKLW